MFTPARPESNAVHYLLDRHLQEHRGHACALLQPGRSPVSYEETGRTTAQIARLLHLRGVRPGQPVGVLLPDSQEFAFSFLACLKLGAVAVPLNTFSPSTALQSLLKDCPDAFVITSGKFAAAVHELIPSGDEAATVIILDRDAWKVESADFLTQAVEPLQPALWLYTSGSTGEPKAVVHTHRGIVASLRAYPEDVLHLSRRDRCYSTSKCFFAYGLGNTLLFPLAAGASAVLDPEPTCPGRVLQVLAQFHPSLFFSVPTVYHRLLNHPSMDPTCFQSVRLCLSAGEYLPVTLFHAWHKSTGRPLVDGIGSTEALHIFCSNSAHQPLPGTSGKPVAGYQLTLVDDEGQPVEDGTIGHLLVAGPSLATGYRNSPDAQSRNFGGGVLRTGDLYWRDAVGNYVYGGRKDDGMKSAGMWITPVEIEQCLLARPGVLEAVVVPAMDAAGFEVPKAFVVPTELPIGTEATQQFVTGLLASLATELTRHKIPKLVEVVATLPRTATGKVARHLLRQKEWPVPKTSLPTCGATRAGNDRAAFQDEPEPEVSHGGAATPSVQGPDSRPKFEGVRSR